MGAHFSESFLSILSDPITGAKLNLSSDRKALVAESNSAYPILSERTICLLPRPELALSHFLSQWKLLYSKLDEEINQYQNLLNLPATLEPETRARLESFRKSRIEFKRELAEIFSALPNYDRQANDLLKNISSTAHQSLGMTVPLAQPLIGYPQNLFRDWVWGDDENKKYIAVCKDFLATCGVNPKRVLILAAGGGRLAWDLHQELNTEFTVAFDNSYFFSQCFDQICFQSGLKITEFPAAPKTDADQFRRHSIAARKSPKPNLHYVLGDLNYLPFAPGSFDCIITPWIIDLIPQKIPLLIHNVSTLLKPNEGVWINFGSFQIPAETPPLFRFSHAEIKMLAQRGDFGPLKESFPLVNYLESPYGAQYRVESLWAFAGQRGQSPAGRLVRALGTPEWLLNLDKPIPKTDQVGFSEMMHKVPKRVFELIDGTQSLNQIAVVIAAEFEMTPSEAAGSLVGFLSRWSQDVKAAP